MSEIITYNKPEDSDRRKEASNITFDEEKEAAKIINDAIEELTSIGHLSNEEISLVQKFVDNYQNLSHHKSITVGLYATDKVDKVPNDDSFFQIEF